MQTIIFGGAFDPPHIEHLRICQEAIAEIGADKLVLVPTFNPPHKACASIDFELRVSMLQSLFQNVPFEVEISDFEKTSGFEKNYAAMVLPELVAQYGECYYLIGGDSLLDFDKWFEPKTILSTLPILVAGRKGENLSNVADVLTEKYGGKIRLLQTVGDDVSSSIVRANLLMGDSATISDGVMQIIKQQNLFHEYDSMIEKLKNRLSTEKFEHSKAVVRRAVDLNSKCRLHLDFEKVFLSALLHDNSKEMLDTTGISVPKDSIGSPVLHQFLGAERAKTDFGIDDEEILEAICVHTTAKPKMTTLDKLIFCADMISEDRNFYGMETLIESIYSNFEKGFLDCLEHSYNHVMSKGRTMYSLTKSAYDYYLGTKY